MGAGARCHGLVPGAVGRSLMSDDDRVGKLPSGARRIVAGVVGGALIRAGGRMCVAG
jgi:hypothetical protein